MNEIRWRLNDPAIEWRQRWTRVHVVDATNDARTLCGVTLPDAYDTDYAPAAGLDKCKRCAQRATTTTAEQERQ